MTDDATIDALLEAARQAREHAYAPYSGFPVGAAVESDAGRFSGANVENAAYPSGTCAECNAAGAAVSAGARRIAAVVVTTLAEHPTPPCGQCRQFLSEFGPAMLVVSEAADGTRRRWRLTELLPHAFGPPDLSERHAVGSGDGSGATEEIPEGRP